MRDQTSLERKLESIENLPTLPAVLEKLENALCDPKSDAFRVARIIRDDPAITARIMKVVNSAYYDRSGVRISSLQQAVARLGMRAVRNIALSTVVFSMFDWHDDFVFDRTEFWRHSISTGITVSVLYDRVGHRLSGRYSRDTLHVIGLLHDVGKIILEQYFHDSFRSALDVARSERCSLIEAENQVLGTNHARVGAWLGQKWHLPPEALETIRHHHTPMLASPEHAELVLLCHAANYICNFERIGDGGDTVCPTFTKDAWKALGLEVGEIPEMVDQIHTYSQESEILLSIQ